MDGNSSLERRYSFNMAQVNPVAESTHLNGSSFSWGTSLSPKHRSNSSICLNNTHTPSACNNKSIVSPKSKNITKIDARIAADVQSKGLASRIVKYHESGTRLNRSMSAHNLYSKPGQFPAVTLKKTDLPYRATKQELSMIRIAPPEKSSFLGNTISSLLRSSSVMGLQQSKRNEDLSRENRPIIHPPPTENDMAPTRSVLDVLKEISRKRINSDDLEVDETSKKYCNRAGNDSVDTGNNTSTIPQHFLTSSLSCQRYKRQRDCITPHHSVQIPETRTSPEQAKKRVCNYNNDITSSLSSSIKCKPYGNAKRVSASTNLNQTMPTNLESYEMQKAKMQRYHDHSKTNNTRVDVRFENLENTLRKVDNTIKPITPIPTTPCGQDQNNIGGVPPMRTVSEPTYNPDRTSQMNLIQAANKPRLTLFNKKYDDDECTGTNESGTSIGENTDDLNDLGECAGIPFVKPKKLSSISGLRNPVIERTQKSKLALMLSGLRGELYQNSDGDELDSAKEKLDIPDNHKVDTNSSAVISALKSTSTITTLTTVTSSCNAGMTNTSSSLNFSTNTKTSSPLVGLKLSQPKVSSANVGSTLSIDATKNLETNPKPNVPVLGGFSFGTSNTSSTPVVNAVLSNSTLKDPKASEASISSISANNSNAFNFGQSTQLTSKLSSASDSNNTNKLSANPQTSTKDNLIQFPAVSAAFTLATTKTSTASTVPSSLSATSAFSFGTNVTAPASTISTSTAAVAATSFTSTVKPNNGFSFTAPSTTSLPVTNASVAPIMFGASASSATSINSTTTTSAIATTTTSVPTFGAVTTSANLGGLTSTTSFAFNTSKQSSTIQPITVSSSSGVVSAPTFNFGSNVNSPSVPTFGTNTNAVIKPQPTSSGFSFGSDPKNQNSSSGAQNDLAATSKQPDNNAFNSSSSTLFGSPGFNAPSSGPTPIFGNATNSSEKNVFNSSNATSIFGSSSVKGATQTFGLNVDNKSAALVTPSVFGGSSTNNSTPTPFSFGSKPAIAQTTNSNNTNAASGGFSFSSAVSNSSEGGTFGFGSKTDGTTNTSSNTFGGTSTSVQNKNFTFGGAASSKPANPPSVFGGAVNKPTENTASPGGFSFGSALAPKTSTFSFGASSNSFSGSNANGTNNTSSSFSFGAAASIKTNEVSTNKPFSFGSPQPQQQQQQQQIMSAPNNSNTNPPNIFGSSVTSKTAPAPAFSFNSGSSTNLQPNVPASNNLFAPPPSTITTGPGDRPIRRATRRLQK
ncbi:nuclear pore complex protein DDB_G0274915 [Lucilia sericata]|uniref:nuclear pore complex protein DDB_G0274915 n=1 Tax=Lucilia sericata TaxID=13632 RepID=UPI0018A7E9AD|nr:nuclear pore complex protein DDB_G0274915 [Lucilia sericata]